MPSSCRAPGRARIWTARRSSPRRVQAGCDAIHPGYGFLSESAAFARDCARSRSAVRRSERRASRAVRRQGQGARRSRRRLGVPVLRGTFSGDDARGSARLLRLARCGRTDRHQGDRGRRRTRHARRDRRSRNLPEAYARCQSEAAAAFGSGEVYVEEYFPRARHIEIQVIGDGSAVTHLWERECSLQRRHQKIVEIAPSPTLPDSMRHRLIAAALKMAREVRLRERRHVRVPGGRATATHFAFIEANARLQVEHTVTEEVLGIDLVQTQLRLAAGATLAELGLQQGSIPHPRGYAMQLRVNMESMQSDGTTRPTGGTLTAFEPPAGPGIRVDSFGYAGYRTSPSFDSLLAKVIAHSASDNFTDVVQRAYRALCEFRIEGVATNIGFLQNLLCQSGGGVERGRYHFHRAARERAHRERQRASALVCAAIGECSESHGQDCTGGSAHRYERSAGCAESRQASARFDEQDRRGGRYSDRRRRARRADAGHDRQHRRERGRRRAHAASRSW